MSATPGWSRPRDAAWRTFEWPTIRDCTATPRLHGWPPLIDAIVERVRQRHGVATERDQVLVTGGATLGLGVVVGAMVAPGDEVLIAAPYWPLIDGIVRTFHGGAGRGSFLGEVDSAE